MLPRRISPNLNQLLSHSPAVVLLTALALEISATQPSVIRRSSASRWAAAFGRTARHIVIGRQRAEERTAGAGAARSPSPW